MTSPAASPAPPDVVLSAVLPDLVLSAVPPVVFFSHRRAPAC